MMKKFERKSFVKYHGVLIDNNLSWKFHVDYISLKISKTIGIISRLRHFIPTSILLNIYRSLIHPYISFGLLAWGRSPSGVCNFHTASVKRRFHKQVYF